MFVDILLARPTANSRRTVYIYVLLILLWHWIVINATNVLVDWWLGYGSTSNGKPIPQSFKWSRVYEEWLTFGFSATLLVLVILEGLLGFLAFCVGNWRKSPDSRLFIRTWWRACGWGTLVIPIVSLAIANGSMQYEIGGDGILLSVMFLIFAPAYLVRGELKPSRRSRWRPECPECGYLLRGSTAPRCSECGTDFPTKRTTFRRWAVRRLPWDRTRRGSALSAYVKTIVRLCVSPAKAARGVTLPDRWHRCGWWTVGHLLLAASIAVLLGHDQNYIRWAAEWISPPAYRPPDLLSNSPPLARITLWAGQSLIAWWLALVLPIAVACLISLCAPGRHRAARLGGVKWSLYLTPLLLLALLGWNGFHFAFPPEARAKLPMACWSLRFPPDVPVWPLVGAYGIWWAIGITANLYNRSRHWTAAIGYAAAFFGLWLVTAGVLFAPGSLEVLK
jgi:hypothetical protein